MTLQGEIIALTRIIRLEAISPNVRILIRRIDRRLASMKKRGRVAMRSIPKRVRRYF